MNKPRQPSTGNSHCTGKVEDNMPSEPLINIHALARSCRALENKRRKQVSGAIRQAETPAPIKNRASSNCGKFPDSANARQPKTASDRKDKSTRLAPQRSKALPSGNCISAKPRK